MYIGEIWRSKTKSHAYYMDDLCRKEWIYLYIERYDEDLKRYCGRMFSNPNQNKKHYGFIKNENMTYHEFCYTEKHILEGFKKTKKVLDFLEEI